jgi:hypothetical protein
MAVNSGLHRPLISLEVALVVRGVALELLGYPLQGAVGVTPGF